MPLLPATLASELNNLALYDTEAAAIEGWATAWINYWASATSNGMPVTPPAEATLAAAKLAMSGAMVGLSSVGATAIQAGITAFWGILVATPVAIFAAATLITPPPTLGSIASLLAPVFTTNAVPGITKEIAMRNISVSLHTNNLGGTATFPVPIVAPIL